MHNTKTDSITPNVKKLIVVININFIYEIDNGGITRRQNSSHSLMSFDMEKYRQASIATRHVEGKANTNVIEEIS